MSRRITNIAAVAFSILLGSGCQQSASLKPQRAASDRASILLFSDVRGALKPCGCSPDLQRGGVDRVAHYVADVRRSAPNALLLHAGNLLVDEDGVLPGAEAQITRRVQALSEALQIMGTGAVTLGAYDVIQGLDWLEKRLPSLGIPVVLTNAEGPRWAQVVRRTLIVNVDGVKVGVMGLVPERGEGITNPLEAARRASLELRAAGVDTIIVLSSLGLRKAKRLLRKGLDVDIFHAAGQDMKALVSDEVESFGKSYLLQSFIQGGQVGRIDLTVGEGSLAYVETTAVAPKRSSYFRYGLYPIGWDLPQHPEVASVMASYDSELKAINLNASSTLPPLADGQAHYVGVETCLECHDETLSYWNHDKHKTAWDTLVRDNKTYDLECVGCHATGYGKPGGSILSDMKNLQTVQCESCHGPGSLHAEDAEAESISRSVPESVCVTCHNPKHSTRFEYELYKSRVLVPGHGKPLE